MSLFQKFSVSDDGLHPYVGDDGAFLGDHTPLLQKDAAGWFSLRPRAELEILLSLGYGVDVDLSDRMENFRLVAKALNARDYGRAQIALLHAQLPPLPSRQNAARMQAMDGLMAKDMAWLHENRDRFGRWIADLLSILAPSAAAATKPASHLTEGVDAHLEQAQFRTLLDGKPPKNALPAHPIPFKDKNGQVILTSDGRVMQVPSTANFSEIAAVGESFRNDDPLRQALVLESCFKQGGRYDFQRWGGNHPEYRDVSTVGIGVMAAAMGLSQEETLLIQKGYAAYKSKWTGEPISSQYDPLPVRNVENTKLGYKLYLSGRL